MIPALTAVASALSLLGAPAPGVLLHPCAPQRIHARCGTLVVPENRRRPFKRHISLKVVVIPAEHQPAPKDAFTVIAGGPGGAATDMTFYVASTYASLHRTRDIVLVDQRGTGGSNPLTCPPPPKEFESVEEARPYVRRCLRRAPGDFLKYGTRAAIEDLEAVRTALGYRTFDVEGASYGATVAQAYLRLHPSSIRTLVLDGATAVDVPFYSRFAGAAQQALDQVAARCAADRPCARALPGWEARLRRLVTAWNRHPVRTRSGITVTGDELAGVTETMLTDAGTAALVPLLVTRAAAGDLSLLDERLAGSSDGSTQLLMYWSIWCNEPWVGLRARGPWHTLFDGMVEASLKRARAVCSLLPRRAEPRAAWTFPVSAVPVLVLAGGADPQDPISNLPNLRQALPNSHVIVVPGLGHTVGQYGCLGDVVALFVAHSGVADRDTRCVRSIVPPPFILR